MKVLIVGGSGGIGGATVKLLRREGHDVIFSYRNQGDKSIEIEETTGAKKIHFDFSSEESIKKLTSMIETESFDGLVYAAVEKIKRDTILKTSNRAFLECIHASINGYYPIAKAFALSVKNRKSSGSIVNILSSVVFGLPPAKQACYVSAKYALLGLTRCQAVEFGEFGVRVNSVSPSMTQTPFNSDLPDRFIEIYAESLPARRLATPEEVAHAVRFLLLPESSYLQGVNIPVSGGLVC